MRVITLENRWPCVQEDAAPALFNISLSASTLTGLHTSVFVCVCVWGGGVASARGTYHGLHVAEQEALWVPRSTRFCRPCALG